ncbi:hypothetical protein [Mycolicibacterium grossiae]|uniref:Uncharacterized protein n=1 Tax=Mycolicibacterium grossiae TaxID=1552759 RepID=A0A1E8Q7J4_9MYCO|nr:hypothetical protein [Mycolicibacterium grossiae]OFJ54060.1 hypothetical protein BEL07_09385 [Mycolicibacterium grossiae]QEM44243.1 hypothetical protein FZ046_05155 [Mycolicibacterium grossiae]
MRDIDVSREARALRRDPRRSEVTTLALEVHVRAVARSTRSQRPSFVSDADLDAVAPPRVATMAAIELCLAALWRRAEDGYVVTDVDYVARVLVGGHERATWRRPVAAARRLWATLNSERFIPL